LLEAEPFTLYFSRPFVTPEGGLIIQGETFSDSLFSFRRSDLGEADEGNIIHTTFGYINSKDKSMLRTISARLAEMPFANLSFRIRELRMAMSVGVQVTFEPELLRLRRQPFLNRTDSEIAKLFRRCVEALDIFQPDRTSSLVLLEQAMNCIEAPPGDVSLRMAERLSNLLLPLLSAVAPEGKT
jgi:hypothetical protein